jgi:hypothetical protein
VTLTPAGREAPALATRGGALPDVVVLLALPGLAALRGAGPHRPTVVALWEGRFPEDLRDFLARRDEADGWIFSDPV